MRKLIMAVVVALAGVAALAAAISLGDDGASRSEVFDRSADRVAVHRVSAPSASASASVEASAKKPKVKYFETDSIPIPTTGDAITTACPSKHKALSGYFLSSGGIVLDTSAVGTNTPREWLYGFLNLSGADGEAIAGVVCGKRL
jgi:hypothetical protein